MNNLFEFDKKYRERGYRYLCGIDEAGRGPLAGPVVAAAVIFAPDFTVEGLDDSKKLTEKKREELYPIIKKAALAYGIGQVEADEIDKINILQATFKAMGLAVEGLNIQADYLLVDGRDFPRFFIKRVREMLNGEAVVKGDGKSASIAAASVLAKVYRDNIMRKYAEQYPAYDFDRHKGYGTKIHRELIIKNGPCPIHRRSFLKNILTDYKASNR
jgi:ribonuclease HII